MNYFIKPVLSSFMLIILSGCTSVATRTRNEPGRPSMYESPDSPGAVQGIGIEAEDIVSMTDKMVRDMLTCPALRNRSEPARVIIDSEYFVNEGSSIINKKSITDRLRIELSRAANQVTTGQGGLIFVARHFSDMVEKERELKRQGVVDSATRAQTDATFGADFRLGGRITTLDSIKTGTGEAARYHQIVFEMVDLETGQIVWTGMYEFRKSGQDDVIYR